MSAKGLSYGKASRQERNIQRNKAVLMLIVVVIVLYVVLKLSS
jgi:predicted nucleic acid-binding Zn ribbon protein